MKLIWELKLDSENPWQIDFNCRPIIFDNNLVFVFKQIDKTTINPNNKYSSKIVIYQVNISSGQFEKSEIKFKSQETYKSVLLPSEEWIFEQKENSIKLDAGICIDILSGLVESVPKKVDRKKMLIINDRYNFGDKTLKYNQKTILECFSTYKNSLLWRLQLTGYIFTKIEQKDGHFAWGTAGKGGAFYFVESDTGQIKTEYKNSDASNYEWFKETVLLKTTKGEFCQIDPKTGKLIGTLKLDGEILSNPITVFDNLAFVITHNLKKEIAKINLISLN